MNVGGNPDVLILTPFLTRQRFANSIHELLPQPQKRVTVLAMFTWDIILSDNDVERAKREKIALFDERDLEYYEKLAAHLGPAARYQFFADLVPGRRLAGLETSVPALQTRMGKYTCYTFSIRPDYLLKIAYVSHRAKGKATDIDTYQRMVRKSRLKKIGKYITANGVFPTNVVINLQGSKTVRFDPGKVQGAPEGAKHGMLHLRPSYGCAWVIDGQHRLFAYSGHDRAATSYLNVLAFKNLPHQMQAKLFIDINHEQKSVKRNLIHELFAELHWASDDEEKRVQAIISKTVQALSQDRDSPFHGRILLTDDKKTAVRCITLEAVFKAIGQKGMFVVKKELEYGPLWTGDDEGTLQRARFVLKEWFSLVRDGASEWWARGAEEGGGLAMNDGVTVCVAILRSVFDHLRGQGYDLIQMSERELADEVRPFGEALGRHLGSLSPALKASFRASARGVQGQTAMRRQCEKALHGEFPSFSPPGLEKALELVAARTNEQAFPIIKRIEKGLHTFIVGVLQAQHPHSAPDVWWYERVPSQIRRKAIERHDEEKGRGSKYSYLDLIDLRKIALKNWGLFQGTLEYTRKGTKEKRTEWIVKINNVRKVVMHNAPGRMIDFDQLEQLKDYESWMEAQLAAVDSAKLLAENSDSLTTGQHGEASAASAPNPAV
jgi:DNA sulfur modification protein DndB